MAIYFSAYKKISGKRIRHFEKCWKSKGEPIGDIRLWDSDT